MSVAASGVAVRRGSSLQLRRFGLAAAWAARVPVYPAHGVTFASLAFESSGVAPARDAVETRPHRIQAGAVTRPRLDAAKASRARIPATGRFLRARFGDELALVAKHGAAVQAAPLL